MAIVLDHTIVPAHDKEASARFLARILGLRYEGALSHFAPLRVNDTLTPGALDDMKINRRGGGRGFYFRDPNGHVLEVLTA
jgi:catechol 2,3-dioxygenase-like lactoylglutathione lyase family enzyme